MDELLPLLAVLYAIAGLGAAMWSYRHASHRPEASTVAKVGSSILVGLVWPAMLVDLWLLDPDDTRGRRGREHR